MSSKKKDAKALREAAVRLKQQAKRLEAESEQRRRELPEVKQQVSRALVAGILRGETCSLDCGKSQREEVFYERIIGVVQAKITEERAEQLRASLVASEQHMAPKKSLKEVISAPLSHPCPSLAHPPPAPSTRSASWPIWPRPSPQRPFNPCPNQS